MVCCLYVGICFGAAPHHMPDPEGVHPEGVPWVADYAYGELPRNMPSLYVWFVVNSGETSKGSIPGEQLWVEM